MNRNHRNFTYNAAKVISDYLRISCDYGSCKTEYSICDTQKFPSTLLSYDVQPSLTNILRERIINHLIEKIYVHEKLRPICSKLILRGLFMKFAAKSNFQFNSRSLKERHYPSKFLSWWRRIEDVLKASFLFIFRRPLQDVFKTSSSIRIYSSQSYVFRRRLEDVFMAS